MKNTALTRTLPLALALIGCTTGANLEKEDAGPDMATAPGVEGPEGMFDTDDLPDVSQGPNMGPPGSAPGGQGTPMRDAGVSPEPQPPGPPTGAPGDPPPPDQPPPDQPPRVDECADAGAACDVCACRICDAQLDACFADAGCQSVVDCARETGCSGLDCLASCGDVIEAAGGAFGPAVGLAQAVSTCRDEQCGMDDAACQGNDPGPPEPPPPPVDPVDPGEPPPPADECADAGAPCDVCACHQCSAELDACFADPGCQSVVDCARRTGCGGIDCLESCGAEIEAAGGAFGASVALAQGVSGCRDTRCGADDAECAAHDPAPQPEPGPDPEPGEPLPPAGDCGRFPADEFCGQGVNASGVAWCEFYVESDGDSCDDVCGRAGSRCLDAWDDEDGGCQTDERTDCDDGGGDLICRCAL